MKLFYYIIVLLIFLSNSSRANIIKWTNCKIIESPFAYKIMTEIYKSIDKELFYGDFIKEENDDIEYSNVTFDIDNKKFIRRQKNKDKDLVENKHNFEFINENIVKIIDEPYEIKFPFPKIVKSGDKEIKLDNESKYFAGVSIVNGVLLLKVLAKDIIEIRSFLDDLIVIFDHNFNLPKIWNC